jgi:hypothetical protein
MNSTPIPQKAELMLKNAPLQIFQKSKLDKMNKHLGNPPGFELYEYEVSQPSLKLAQICPLSGLFVHSDKSSY